MFSQIRNPLVDLVYPPQCLICKNRLTLNVDNRIVCRSCISLITLNHPPFCLHCCRHLPEPVSAPVCLNCQNNDLHFDFAWSASLYEEPIQGLIHLFKYSGKTGLRFLFAQIMIDFIHQFNLDIRQFDKIVPIPLFASRFRERGYNQAYLIAELISLHFHIPLCAQNLVRKRPTQSQTLLDRKKRWTNVEDAFKIKHPAEINEQSILLVDDLLTSGATASQAARSLKDCGAKQVAVLTLSSAVESP